MKSKITISKKLFVFLVFSLLCTSMTFAQSVPPANTSCTSNDLEVVAAKLTGGDVCNSCATTTPLTRTLTLSINNKTGSTRAVFAFWGTLEIYSGTTGALISSVTRTGCAGPVASNSITSLDFGTITYNCGDVIKITNLWEAWTTPSGACPLNPNDISPKCGKLPSITVNGGVNGEFALIQSQCASPTGAIDLTPTGGTAPFTYTWTASNGGVVPAGQATNQDLTGLVPGDYTVVIKDANNCTISKTRTITATIPSIAVFSNTSDTTVGCGGATTSSLSYTNSSSGTCLISGTVTSTLSTQTPAGACGGTVTETWTYTDAYGRTIVKTRTITVSPAALPTMTAPAATTVACGSLPAPSTLPFTNGLSGGCLISGTSNPSTFSATPNACGGTVTETWTATDSCGRALAPVSRIITVNPAALPTMTAKANTTVACGSLPAPSTIAFSNGSTGGCLISGTSNPSTFSATPDACGGTVTETWTATDSCGRALAPVSRTITVSPAALPTMTAPANIVASCGGLPIASTLPFTNGLSGGCSINGTSNLSTFSSTTTGFCNVTFTETWTATDSCGRALAPVSRTIIINDTTKPTFTAPEDITIYTTANCTYDASVAITGDVTDEADNCSTNLNATFTDVVTNGNCQGSKTITRTWSLSDLCGNQAIPQNQIITITDNIVPSFTAPADITIYTTANCSYDTSVEFTGDVTDETDNCSTNLNATFNDLITNGTCEGSKIITRTWNLMDLCGNKAISQTQTITVEDNIKPTFTVPADITIYTTDACTYDASVTFTGDVTDETDNCSTDLNATFTDATPVAGACAGSYTIVRTWSLTDCAGNNTTHDQTITVSDNIKPTFTVPADITIYTTDACTYDASVQFTGDVTDETDNCSTDLNAIFTDAAPVAGACAGSYTIVRTWSLTDCAGNNTTHDQTITVSDNIKPTFTVPADITIYTTDACTYDASVQFTGDVTDEADNCSTDLNATFTDAAPVAGACAGSYTIVRTWSLNDCAGNNTTHDQTITVSDNIKPTFTVPADITIYTTDACTYDASVQFTGDVTDEADNCSTDLNATYTDAAPVAGACAGAYTIVRTWSLTDCAGNNTTHDQTITVSDNIKPTFTVPADITIYTTDACTYDASVQFTGDVTDEADNCSTDLNATFTDAAPVAGQCAGSYTIVRTWSLTDCAGNNTTHDQTITVSDNIKPTFTVPADITIYTTDACTYDASVQFTGDVTDEADNCSTDLNATFTDAAPVAGQCAGSYTIVRTWSLTDCAGNNTTHEQTITVSDNIKPTFTAPADITIYTTDACTYDASVQFTGDVTDEADNCSTDLNATFTDADPVAGECSGGYAITRTWSLTDCAGNTTTHTQLITLTDNIAPTFTVPADITIYTTDTCTYDASFQFTGDVTDEADNCSITNLNATFTDAAPVAGQCAGSYTIVRTWSLTDCSNNNTTHTQTITVSDNIKPTFTAPADITIYTTDACTYDASVTFTGDVTDEADNCSTDLNATFTDAAPVAGACTGSYTIVRTWSLTDCAGNNTTHDQTITVSDNIKPTFTAPADTTIYTTDACTYDASVTFTGDVTDEADNCSTDLNATFTDAAPVAGACAGSYTIVRTWSLTDCAGNNTTHNQTITVSDNIKPTFTAPADITIYTTDACTYDASVTFTGDVTDEADNCSTDLNATFTDAAPVAGACAGSYTIVRTWSLTDCAGNNTTHDQTITVSDNIKPTFTVPADITIYTTDACTYDASVTFTGDVTDEADNCSTDLNATFTDATPVAGDCAGSYTIVRTWSLTDCAGNNTTHDQTITVSDNIKPTFTAPADITIHTTADCTYNASITFTGDVTDEADNCSTDLNATFTDAAPVAGACAGSYTIVRTWSLTDCAGNNTTHDQTITVSDNIFPTFTEPADITIYTTDTCTYDASVQFTGDVTDEGDNCSTGLNATYYDDLPVVGACAGSLSIVRHWSLTDCAGNTTTQTQFITVSDNIKPTWATLAGSLDLTLECDDAQGLTDAQALAPQAIDNCTANVGYIKTPGSYVAADCPNRGTYTNTWIAYDACSNETLSAFTQVITIQDTKGPEMTTVLSPLSVTCDAIPAPQSVTFADNCSGVVGTPVLTEVQSPTVNNTYTITRTWTATDACGNLSAPYSQVITVTTPDAQEFPAERCNAAEFDSIDLMTLLPNGTPTTGTWTNVNNVGGFTGTVFNAWQIPTGDYTFSYAITNDPCPRVYEVKMNVNDECKPEACDDILVHNAFTPNGDGVNEYFDIEFIDLPCHQPNSVEIYNRWGVLVYETKNYDNNTRKFTGVSEGRSTVSKSDELPAGTYFYILQYSDGNGNTVTESKYLYLTR
ncbi:T9SS type B sorting domain-containing protein [Flavobacterium phycosphaerae]|uniref:T9SS type B sorting domain-containing protein n=1 Tax=Flavobacterium phycosphaerae TaxID=2697515 RepID=UPI001F30176B|nr:gliding motility-associated C-terminal domain-containing protein [Flavobacterium phycosphaerae]